MTKRFQLSSKELLDEKNPETCIARLLEINDLSDITLRTQLPLLKEPVILEFDQFLEHPLFDLLENIQQKHENVYVIWGSEHIKSLS